MLTKRIKLLLTPWNLFVLIILLSAFVLRIYRIGELLDFHYDQGRDAKVIWDLWHTGKFFLIGPTTGLDGVFLGPFYYYLIAPFYLIGNGNPVIPSIFLSILVTFSLYVLYLAGNEMGGKRLGIVALTIGSFSYLLITSGRWLSNPTPIYLTSILLFYTLLKIVKEKKTPAYRWYLSYLLAGLSFHFESASAIFYLPILLIFTVWQRKKLNLRDFLISGSILFATFLPQIIFNFKHDNILFRNFIIQIQKTDKSTAQLSRLVSDRLKVLWEIFYVKIFPENMLPAVVFSFFSLGGLLLLFKTKGFRDMVLLLLIFLGIPFVGYIVYRGNHGVLYDYYLTGYYLIIVLAFSVGIWKISLIKFGNIFLAIFIVLFLVTNFKFTVNRLTLGVFDGQDIFLSNQLAAIDWIYKDAESERFNVDVYVPPVIPHSYDYLLLWYENTNKITGVREENQVKLLYTLYEVDPPHPDRLEAWLARQKGIGKVIKEEKFGGIVVQKRERILFTK